MSPTISPSVLTSPVTGLRLSGPTLQDQLSTAGRPTLLAFVRHFACIFCREMVKDLRAASGADPAYPNVVVVCMGTPDESREFFDKYWPDVRVICDPEKKLYDAFGIGAGSLSQMFGPRVWACGIRATVKGNRVGNVFARPIGDPWTMPGAIVLDAQGNVLWSHTFDHAGDHPDWRAIPKFLATPANVALGSH